MSGASNFDTCSRRVGDILRWFGTGCRKAVTGRPARGAREAVPDRNSVSLGGTPLADPATLSRLGMMMLRLGLISEEIDDHRLLREIALNCALCDEISDCRDWLGSMKTAGYHRFCRNAPHFDRLLLAARKAAARRGGAARS